MPNRLYFILFLLTACLCLLQSAHAQTENKTFKVIYISDGDSLLVADKYQKIKVRMIGIDAPESYANEKAKRDSNRSGVDTGTIVALGKKSSQYLRQILATGSEVSLVYDVSKLDKYGRTLAYVYTKSGLFLNLKMIEDGYAYPYSIPPNLRHKKDFLKAAQQARVNKIGLWKE